MDDFQYFNEKDPLLFIPSDPRIKTSQIKKTRSYSVNSAYNFNYNFFQSNSSWRSRRTDDENENLHLTKIDLLSDIANIQTEIHHLRHKLIKMYDEYKKFRESTQMQNYDSLTRDIYDPQNNSNSSITQLYRQCDELQKEIDEVQKRKNIILSSNVFNEVREQKQYMTMLSFQIEEQMKLNESLTMELDELENLEEPDSNSFYDDLIEEFNTNPELIRLEKQLKKQKNILREAQDKYDQIIEAHEIQKQNFRPEPLPSPIPKVPKAFNSPNPRQMYNSRQIADESFSSSTSVPNLSESFQEEPNPRHFRHHKSKQDDQTDSIYISSRVHRSSPKISVGLFTKRISENEIKWLFSQYGKITNCEVIQKSRKKPAHYYAIIQFDSRKDAQKAINKSNHKRYKDTILSVRWWTRDIEDDTSNTETESSNLSSPHHKVSLTVATSFIHESPRHNHVIDNNSIVAYSPRRSIASQTASKIATSESSQTDKNDSNIELQQEHSNISALSFVDSNSPQAQPDVNLSSNGKADYIDNEKIISQKSNNESDLEKRNDDISIEFASKDERTPEPLQNMVSGLIGSLLPETNKDEYKKVEKKKDQKIDETKAEKKDDVKEEKDDDSITEKKDEIEIEKKDNVKEEFKDDTKAEKKDDVKEEKDDDSKTEKKDEIEKKDDVKEEFKDDTKAEKKDDVKEEKDDTKTEKKDEIEIEKKDDVKEEVEEDTKTEKKNEIEKKDDVKKEVDDHKTESNDEFDVDLFLDEFSDDFVNEKSDHSEKSENSVHNDKQMNGSEDQKNVAKSDSEPHIDEKVAKEIKTESESNNEIKERQIGIVTEHQNKTESESQKDQKATKTESEPKEIDKTPFRLISSLSNHESNQLIESQTSAESNSSEKVKHSAKQSIEKSNEDQANELHESSDEDHNDAIGVHSKPKAPNEISSPTSSSVAHSPRRHKQDTFANSFSIIDDKTKQENTKSDESIQLDFEINKSGESSMLEEGRENQISSQTDLIISKLTKMITPTENTELQKEENTSNEADNKTTNELSIDIQTKNAVIENDDHFFESNKEKTENDTIQKVDDTKSTDNPNENENVTDLESDIILNLSSSSIPDANLYKSESEIEDILIESIHSSSVDKEANET